MIADEPETGLDPVLRRVVNELMLKVAEYHGVGLMLISHNMDTVRRCADHVVRIGHDAPDPFNEDAGDGRAPKNKADTPASQTLDADEEPEADTDVPTDETEPDTALPGNPVGGAP